MPRVAVQLTPELYESQAPPLSHRLCTNLFAERAPPGSDVGFAMLFAPGIDAWTTVGVGPIRGYRVFNDVLYVVSADTLYSVSSAGVATALGTIPGTTEELVFMDDNGFDLLIVTGESDSYKGYYYDGATVTNISDADFPDADWIVFMDQYIVVGVVGTQQFQISALADVTTWDALDFASAESAPDKLIMGIHDHNELVLFGGQTLEVWYNSGSADFPFERAMDGIIEVGCAAKRSVAKLDGAIFFLATDQGGLSVRMMRGRVPQRISTHGIEKDLDQASTVADGRGFTYTYRGHAYYVLTLPTAGHTFVYDISGQTWHRRKSKDCSCWRPLGIASVYDELIVIDSDSNRLGKLNADSYREFGSEIPWEITTLPISAQGRRFVVNRFILEVDPGTALRVGQGSAPFMWLSWSDDDGRTWSNEHRKDLGITGDYTRELTWQRLGNSRKRIFRCRGSEPIATALISAYADIEAEQV